MQESRLDVKTTSAHHYDIGIDSRPARLQTTHLIDIIKLNKLIKLTTFTNSCTTVRVD